MIDRKDLMIAILVCFMLAVTLYPKITTSRYGKASKGGYDPWVDYNEDGKIDHKDLLQLAAVYGTSGTPITKASVTYDSGWVDITDKAGQYFNITHNLNSTDIIVDITGKTTTDGGIHQRHLGGTDHISGWSRAYGGVGLEGWAYVVQTGDGGYALGGRTDSGAGAPDFWLIKTDTNGNTEWNKTYGGVSWEYNGAAIQTDDGGYAIACTTASFHPEDHFWLVKTDASGDVQWNKTYGKGSHANALAFIQTNDGGYAITGEVMPSGANRVDFWLVKTDSLGNMQWNRMYGGPEHDNPMSIVQTDDGGFALGGMTKSFAAGQRDFWLVKTDADGNIGFEYGLAWVHSTIDYVILYRGATDPYWNYVRVRIWKIKETP